MENSEAQEIQRRIREVSGCQIPLRALGSLSGEYIAHVTQLYESGFRIGNSLRALYPVDSSPNPSSKRVHTSKLAEEVLA
jgi:hypothetical protein